MTFQLLCSLICLLFADDCKLFRSLAIVDDDSIDQLQNDLNRLQSCMVITLAVTIQYIQVPGAEF